MPIHLLPRDDPEDSSHPLAPARSRREFLRGLATSGAAWTLGAGRLARAADEPRKGTPWLALLADTHIAADRAAKSRGQVMADNLRTVVAEILAQPEPPLGALVVGDLALNRGEPGDYESFLALVEPLLKAKIPLHLALGNHDDRDHFRSALGEQLPRKQVLDEKHVSAVELPGLRLVMLDSLDKVNVTPGLLGQTQLDWVSTVLDARPDSPTLIAVHHNLANTPNALRDTQALLDLLGPRKQVKAVVFGHTHVWESKQAAGFWQINLPAVAYPFALAQPLGWCRLDLEDAGAQLTLHTIGGDRRAEGERLSLRLRTT